MRGLTLRRRCTGAPAPHPPATTTSSTSDDEEESTTTVTTLTSTEGSSTSSSSDSSTEDFMSLAWLIAGVVIAFAVLVFFLALLVSGPRRKR